MSLNGGIEVKITAVKPYAVHPGWRKNLMFVKVETDAGIHGWGGVLTIRS